MLDPELAGVVDLMPVLDLDDPVQARASFDAIILEISRDIPGMETLEIEDRTVPGFEGDPDVAVRVYRPRAATPGTLVRGCSRSTGEGSSSEAWTPSTPARPPLPLGRGRSWSRSSTGWLRSTPTRPGCTTATPR